jgi:DNA-dependent RNA polymerase auxiliary subunit epsilon
MAEIIHFTGFIKGVTYKTYLGEKLNEINIDSFDVNQASGYGLIKSPLTEIAYSKWVSPKRTRSYPFTRIYHTYNSSKIITIIPVIKDEGQDGDIYKIQYSTISWMNLLNVYIVLAYYETAEKSGKKGQTAKNKLTNQKFNNEFIKSQINEILEYRQSALHWNKNLFEDRFVSIFQKALNAYECISRKTGVIIHSRVGMDNYLQKITDEFEQFKNISLKSSQNASKREAMTSHKLEYLEDGLKATFSIENYLGGLYYLTPDEIFLDNDIYIIQESKNSSKESLPKLSDIQDGLFKLILFSNLDSLKLNTKEVSFITKLKLTGKNVIGSIVLPDATLQDIENFLQINMKVFTKKQKEIINKLALECKNNGKIKIQISGNSII